MKHLALAFAFIFSMFNLGHAQLPKDQAAKSEAIMAKMRQIDICNQIIPLVLKKDQVNKLLPVVEKARSKVTEAQKKEAEELNKVEGKIDAAIEKAVKDGVPPSKDIMNELSQMTLKWSLNRSQIIQDNTDMVYKAFFEVTDAGQRKAAANSLAPQLLDPSIKVDKMTEEDKIRFFIQEILLDPQCYPILLRIAKEGKTG